MGSTVESPGHDIAQALAKHGVNVENVAKNGSSSPVSVLSSLYPKLIVSDTDTWRKQFFSAHQQSAKPSLIFQPTSSKDVAIALLLCRQSNTKFAVKSGGHAAMTGASSADEGIVIDLKNLNCVELSEDKSIAKIGAGNRWEHVFEKLAKDGLAVAGGRSGDVGVGGYSLGGGISFFASARGWACDNIRNFELVTAAGDVLDVNYQSYPDLFWALRGGGSNYGIVTRFDYETFPQGDIYAGNVLFDYEHKDAVVKAFTSFAYNSDPSSATWLTVGHHEGKRLLVTLAMYAEPTAEFDLMRAYGAIPSLHGGQKVRSMASMVHEIAEGQAKDHRQNYWNHTFKFDAEFIDWLVQMYFTEFGPYVGKYESDLASVFVMQYYTKESIRYMHSEGGNCLPLKEDEAPYVNLLIPTAWKHEKDDDFVLGLSKKIMDLAVEEGKRRGLFVDFIYMNYGSMYQDVLKGYGKENYDKLKRVAAKYDPDSVFQTLTPGYFKFGGAPA
ncbi:FAD binding domain protein [Cucurbitaria berberidis CBS 394.84]|uniref:FAD binding domain protein n=1 Tax=Cucurbitaria berberidis CBS 394.84 TaxID=1168544 RepID=A0A9P4LCD0_9PLEO|nr:FAD binding domain protein [Cucurbitaria berberidis CBS 394.84]KAF1849247.1 FAD binding domain protein [Cucurbitaria berberidis CBS 394.84]